MIFTVSMDTSNDAFGPSPQDRNDEISRILCNLAQKLRDGRMQDQSEEINLKDLNGNTVGVALFR